MTRAALILLAALVALPARAEAPDNSLRPVARGQTAPAEPARTAAEPATRPKARPEQSEAEAEAEAAEPPQSQPQLAKTRPVARPKRRAAQPAQPEERDTAGLAPAAQDLAREPRTPGTPQVNSDRPGTGAASTATGPGLLKSLRPAKRTAKVRKEAKAARKAREKGAVCGHLDIQGTPVGRVTGHINGCVIDEAMSIRSVSGIPLTQRSVMDCVTARALKSWIDNGLKPAMGSKGGGVAKIKVAAHYACRRRNNASSGKLSEHGKGRAIDISGFVMRDGTTVTLLKHWNSKSYGKALRTMHKKACGPFGTVLGPNANRFHLDHFHFDTARYRSGSYCR